MNGSFVGSPPARRLAFGFVAVVLVACQRETPKDPVELVIPDGSGRTTSLVPRSAFAEYVEVPDSANELRITLASHDLSCERYVAPGEDDTVLVVTLRLPPSEKPHAGSFASTPPLPADGGTAVSRGYAVPVIRRAQKGYALPPGGTLEIEAVDVSPTGMVKGTLAFEFPGDGTRPASSAKGKFRARLCRSEMAPVVR